MNKTSMSDCSVIQIKGYQLKILVKKPLVFPPKPISIALAENLPKLENSDVLDLATGSGIIGIAAAKMNSNVIFSDILEDCVETARYNAKLNGCYNSHKFLKSNFFQSIKCQKLDLIVSNPPCMPIPQEWQKKDWPLKVAVNGGYDGIEMYDDILNQAMNYLKPNGALMLPVPKWSNWKKLMYEMGQKYKIDILDRLDVYFWLIEISSDFKDHADKLLKEGLNDIFYRNGKPWAEILICKLIPK